MDKKESRALSIFTMSMKTNEIHDDVIKTLDEDSLCYSTVKKWIADFRLGRESTDDTATTDAKLERIHRMVINERCVTVKHIADTLGISVVSVHTALTEILGMSKLSVRWIHRGIAKLEHRWSKCINVPGTMLKNNIKTICVWLCFLVETESLASYNHDI